MFTGIVKGTFPIVDIIRERGFSCAVLLPSELREKLAIGASVAVDGVCLTVVEILGDRVYFDLIEETLKVTTFNAMEIGRLVNVERSLKFGDEIGGHLLSGHVMATAEIFEKQTRNEETIVKFLVPERIEKYFFKKGFVAIDGISLTIVETNPLSVHLIPETLRMTTLGLKQPGDRVNIEVDYQTQVLVDRHSM
ncbi:Riboflavin synthase alpha chain [Waddlia chondrophila 2032/99]|uniref:Riboflavin synthase n=1 Tax=Waddlia chondrophila 2032/99 TaxID=765953 RepID=F8LCI7_9BACT|nr:Riboflavin synthase alpha chain [Waddlia chondrophila 2032/99]